MQRGEIEEMQEWASSVCEYYFRRLPWASNWASDMMQEALLAMMTSQKTFNPKHGVFRAYAIGAAANAVRRFLWRNRTVVVPTRVERGGHPLDVLSLHGEAKDAVRRLLDNNQLPCEQLNQRRVSDLVRTELYRLDKTPRKVGVELVLRERSPAEIVAETKMPVKKVYYAYHDLHRKASRSKKLRALFQETRP